jgi:hypothetical protein
MFSDLAIITETSKKVKSMALVFIFGFMVLVTKVIGSTMKFRDQLHLNGWTVGVSKAIYKWYDEWPWSLYFQGRS